MNINKLSLRKIRAIHYRGQTTKLKTMDTDINNFFQNPYSYFKSRYYIEVSAILVFFLQYTKATPNLITIIYSILSFSVLFLLSSNNNYLILFAIILLFTKGVLDWADGLLARIQKKTSNLGFLLDNWAALISTHAYTLGLAIYLYNKDNEFIFIILGVSILFIKALDLRNYAYHLAMYSLFKEKNKKSFLKKLNFNEHSKLKNKKKSSSLAIFKIFIQNFLDDRSRSVDLICFIIFIDIFYYPSDLLKYLYYFIFFKNIIIFMGGIHLITKKEYIFKK